MIEFSVVTKIVKGLYLDDQPEFFPLAKIALYGTNMEIEETEDIKYAEQRSIDNSFSFFICDLRLTQIGTEETGYEILRRVRSANKTVFLALFTTYSYTLLDEKRQILHKEKIKIYSKDDRVSFRKNIEKDYIKFMEYNDKMEQLIKSVESIKNGDITIQVTADKFLNAQELAIEIRNRTEEGLEFFESWLSGIRKKKRK